MQEYLGARPHASGCLLQGRDSEVLLAGKVVVHAALARLSLLQDVLRTGGRVPALPQQLLRGGDQSVFRSHTHYCTYQ